MMTVRVALRALTTRPVRSAVLAGGFGCGIAVMAALLGVGEVILEQARSADLRGGGDVIVFGISGELRDGRALLSVLGEPAAGGGLIGAISPTASDQLYVPGERGALPIRARGGIPSLERAVGDRETSSVLAWDDAPEDEAWIEPDRADLLRSIDRFHVAPDLPELTDWWMEWLYFNGRRVDTSFYVSFIFGRVDENGLRPALVRCQLESDGVKRVFSDVAEVDAAWLLASAPDVDAGASRVRLVGTEYHLRLALFVEGPDGPRAAREPGRRPDLSGELVLDASRGGSMLPLELRGARNWVSGYVVPVMAGAWRGSLSLDGERLSLDGGTGYHDHNWGFWKGVTWQWGQVSHAGFAVLYGRVRPPAAFADPEQMPTFVVVDPPDGPPSFSSGALIEESDEAEGATPREISIRARGIGIDLAIRFDVHDTIRSPAPFVARSEGLPDLEFLQMRGAYTVSGEYDGAPLEFTAPGVAETYRSR
ncbi:MAG: hypothetical protein OEQ13_01715 [Acidobacteriota bacterium]|nr:hypothetical protein [Acidobacteriota bacterium]